MPARTGCAVRPWGDRMVPGAAGNRATDALPSDLVPLAGNDVPGVPLWGNGSVPGNESLNVVASRVSMITARWISTHFDRAAITNLASTSNTTGSIVAAGVYRRRNASMQPVCRVPARMWVHRLARDGQARHEDESSLWTAKMARRVRWIKRSTMRRGPTAFTTKSFVDRDLNPQLIPWHSRCLKNGPPQAPACHCGFLPRL
jgi:hypothetical protein